MPARPALPTGQPDLDRALGTGGWPRGALALIDAPTGSGATSLALASLAACQASGGLVASRRPDHKVWRRWLRDHSTELHGALDDEAA